VCRLDDQAFQLPTSVHSPQTISGVVAASTEYSTLHVDPDPPVSERDPVGPGMDAATSALFALVMIYILLKRFMGIPPAGLSVMMGPDSTHHPGTSSSR